MRNIICKKIYEITYDYKKYIHDIVRDGVLPPSMDFLLLSELIGICGVAVIIEFLVYPKGLIEQYYYLRILCSLPGILGVAIFVLYFLLPVICYIAHIVICKLYRRRETSK